MADIIGSNGLKKLLNLMKSKFALVGNVVNQTTIQALTFKSHDANGFKLYLGGYTVFLRIDESNFWILVSDKNANGFNAMRPFCISLTTGQCTVDGTCTRAYQDAFGADINIASLYRTIDDMQTQINNIRKVVGI